VFVILLFCFHNKQQSDHGEGWFLSNCNHSGRAEVSQPGEPVHKHLKFHISHMYLNTFAASYLNTQGFNNSCLKSPASTLVDLNFNRARSALSA